MTTTFKSIDEALAIATQKLPTPKVYTVNGKQFYSKEYKKLQDRKRAALDYVINAMHAKHDGEVTILKDGEFEAMFND